MKTAALGVLVAFMIALVGRFADEYFVQIVGMAVLFGFFAASVDFSWGRSGVLTLGAALYFGIGAYFVAFGYHAGWAFSLSVLLGMATSLAVALLIGATALRVRASTIQFGLMTLIASLTAQQVAVSLYTITGGSNGISGIQKPLLETGGYVIDLNTGVSYFYVSTTIALLGVFLLLWFADSHFGRLALCVRESEERTAAFGFDPRLVKLTATLITAAASSLAGSLYVPFNGIADPALFGIRPNMLVLVWVALGGQGTLVGPFVAAMLLQIIQFELGSQFQDLYLLLVGILFILSVRSSSGGGLAAIALRLWRHGTVASRRW